MSDAVEYRELKRSDLASFQKVVVQGLGALEHAAGLEQLAITQFKSLEKRGTWILFSLLRSVGDRIGLVPFQIYVGANGSTVLGTATVIPFKNTGYVLGVATDSAARGRGIATNLLEMIERSAQKKGIPWLALDVEAENETAIRLYKKLGYTEAARFSWYTGSNSPPSDSNNEANEVPESEMKEVASWVANNQLPDIHKVFPATRNRFSHLEIIVRPSKSPTKTWKVTSSGEIVTVVRSSYLSLSKTGYIIPAAWNPNLPEESAISLISPVTAWLKSLGAAQIVVVISEPAGSWATALSSLDFKTAVSSILMIKSIYSSEKIRSSSS